MKEAREAFKPKFKSKVDLLSNPVLDEAFYVQLKALKRSSASKANIDPMEKEYRKLSYKVLDLAKPLLFLSSRRKVRRKTRADAKAIKTAIKLWATLYHDILSSRRRNILSQVYPGFIGLLDNTKNFKSSAQLFGPKFTSQLMSQAKVQSTLEDIRPHTSRSRASNSERTTGASSSGDRGGQQGQSRNNEQNNGGYESLKLAFSDSFGGRIARYREAWSHISNDPWIIRLITCGYEIEFQSKPFQHFPRQNAVMTPPQHILCDKEVHALIKKGAVIMADIEVPGFVSGIFLIPKKSGDYRPIINLKSLNKFVLYHHFKMEGLQTVKQTIRRGDWLAKIDLKDAYLSVPIAMEHRKYLRFFWENIVYEFVSLPFGLSSAPWAFSKLLRPISAYLRKRGFRLVVYLDDILMVGACKKSAEETVLATTSLFESLGFVINKEKSVWEPAQSMEYIGLIIDTTTMKFSLTEKKRADIFKLCTAALGQRSITLRDMASILGNFNWASPAVEFAQAHYRNFQALYISGSRQARGNLQTKILLSPEAKADLSWWISQAKFAHGRSIFLATPTLSISSDASLTGWGAVCRGVKTGGPWVQSEANKHINELELLAALKALECFTEHLYNASVELKVDNTSAVSYINKLGGSRSSSLCDMALRIADWCELRNIEIHAVFLPGIANFLADAESRKPLASGDWMLSKTEFEKIRATWPMEVDLFASAWNAQISKFVSWFPQPGAWKTDAFSIDWKELKGYAFPPFNLIPLCLDKVIKEKATLVMIAPYWPSQAWFPTILELVSAIPRLLTPSQDLLTLPLGAYHDLTANHSIRLIAWQLSGIASEAKAFRKTLWKFCWLQQEPIHTLHTRQPGTLGEIGAFDGVVIPCVLA